MDRDTEGLLGLKVGNIRISEVIGEGGMGAVYVGLDERLHRRVAIKVIRAEHRLNPETKARFLREARILSQLNHPNICTVHDLVEGQDCDFLVLELVHGTSLRLAMKEGIDASRKMDIAEQLLEVLAAVHGEGVIHRDLKPDNVMLTPAGGVKVLDFGLARSGDDEVASASIGSSPPLGPGVDDREGVDEGSPDTASVYVKTRLGTALGTIGYMSPEQALGDPATPASDVYSLGLILQEMFTGKPPFKPGLLREQLLFKAARAETMPVTSLAPDLTALIERMKSPAPGARPSALDAREQLRRVIDRPRRRLRRIAVAAVIASLVLGVALAIVLAEQDKSEQAEAALRELLEAEQRVFGEEHPATLSTLGNPATLLRRRGRYGEAEALNRRAVETSARLLGEEHPRHLNFNANLAAVLLRQGHHREAHDLLRETLDLQRRVIGADHPENPRTVYALASLYILQEEHQKAEQVLRQTIEAALPVWDNDHPRNLELRHNLGLALRAQGRLVEAEAQFRHVLDTRRRVLGADHPSTLQSAEDLESVLEPLGRPDEAARHR